MSEYESKTGEVAQALEEAITAGLQAGGDYLLREAQRNVPVLDGDLKNSGAVTVQGTEAVVSYDTEYARAQHEALGWKHPRGGTPKWLELALLNNTDEIQQVIADKIGEVLE